MSKPKLTPRERTVFNHFDSEHTDFVETLQGLEGAVSEVIDALYLDTIIGVEKETVKGRVEELENSLIEVVRELDKHKQKNKKVTRKLIIR